MMMEMFLSAEGLARIKRYEAFSSTIYVDEAGHPTIGWGHMLTAAELAAGTWSGGITAAEADDLLKLDAAPAEMAVSELVSWGLTQDQFDSLVSFAFNCGARALGGSTLLKMVNAGNFKAVAYEFLKWDKVHSGGQVIESEGLRRRRADEARAFAVP